MTAEEIDRRAKVWTFGETCTRIGERPAKEKALELANENGAPFVLFVLGSKRKSLIACGWDRDAARVVALEYAIARETVTGELAHP